MFVKRMKKRTGALLASILMGLLLIIDLSMPEYMNAESPGRPQSGQMSDTPRPFTALLRDQTAHQRQQDVVGDCRRQTIESLLEVMICPQDIPVPDSIPLYKGAGANIIFPKHGFERMYFHGWNECLFVVGAKTGDIKNVEMTSVVMSFKNDDESSAGLIAGFDDCQKRIIALVGIYNVELIRQTAKELHREIPDVGIWRRK